MSSSFVGQVPEHICNNIIYNLAISLALGPLYNRSTHASSTTTRVGGSRDGEVFVRAGVYRMSVPYVKNVVDWCARSAAPAVTDVHSVEIPIQRQRDTTA